MLSRLIIPYCNETISCFVDSVEMGEVRQVAYSILLV